MRMGFEISRLSILDSTRETYETPDFNSNLTIDISGLRFWRDDQYRDFRKKDKNFENPQSRDLPKINSPNSADLLFK